MVMKYFDDQELVVCYMEGNEQVFEVFLFCYKDKIYCVVYNKVCDCELVEDIFQEVFVKIINILKLGNYNEEGKFFFWVMCIV